MATLKNTLVNDTGYLALPTGNTAQRPGSPANGYMRYNDSSSAIEYYASDSWVNFSSNSSFSLFVEYLVAAGGGSGGGSVGGGGGAGGYLTGNSLFSVNVPYDVTVGGGGAAPAVQIKGNPGSNSVFHTQTAVGGGGGAAATTSGNIQSATTGGSGGGGSAYIPPIIFRNAQTAGTTTVGTSTVTVNKPTGLTVGDLMVAGFIVTNNTTAGTWGGATYPSGFTQAATAQAPSTGWNKVFVAYKIADANDVAASNFSFTYTESGGPYRLAVILGAYYYVNQTTPLDVAAAGQFNTESTSVVAPSLTPSNGQPKLIICFYAGSGGNYVTDGVNLTPPAGQTERAEIEPGATAYSTIMMADEAYQSASATGTRTATSSLSMGNFGFTLLIRSYDAPTGTSGGAGTSGQGNSGGSGNANPNNNSTGAGGGGAGTAGSTPSNNLVGGNGGAGLSSSITGNAVTRAGGGGGAGGTTGGTGGSGGGGNGGVGSSAGSAGGVNTGGGGGGGWAYSGGVASAGGSGVVILKIPDTKNATFSAGLTTSNTTITGHKVYTVTGGTGTVTFT